MASGVGPGEAEKHLQREPQPCTQDTLLKLEPAPDPTLPCPSGLPWLEWLLSVSKCPIWGWVGDFRKSDEEELS